MAQITITLNDSKLTEFKTGFLAFCPIPKDDKGKPIVTFEAWVKSYLKEQLISVYKSGKIKLAATEVTVEDDLIT